MGLTIIGLLLLVVAGAIGYVILQQADKSSAPKGKGRAKTSEKRSSASGVARTRTKSRKQLVEPPNPYRSTSIKPGKNACEAALALDQARFLVAGDAIPPLPLPECDARHCTCRYAKHSDRRNVMDGDRRALGGVHRGLLEQSLESERRTIRRGRRDDD